MISHDPGQTWVDHGLCHRLQHMDEVKVDPFGLGDHAGAISHSPANGCEVNSGDDCLQARSS